MEVSPVRHVPKFQTSTRKTDMQHKPCCSYKWLRHNESLLSGNDENFQNASSQKPAKSQPCKQSQVYYMNQFLHKSLTHWLLPLPRTFFPQKSTFHSLISSRWYQISPISGLPTILHKTYVLCHSHYQALCSYQHLPPNTVSTFLFTHLYSVCLCL